MLTCTAEVASTTKVLMSLWKHECYRVIADRFTTQDDKDWFEKILTQVGAGLLRQYIITSSCFYGYCGVAIMVIMFVPHVYRQREEECDAALASEMAEEPYLVDFLRDAPEPTGRRLNLSLLLICLTFLCFLAIRPRVIHLFVHNASETQYCQLRRNKNIPLLKFPLTTNCKGPEVKKSNGNLCELAGTTYLIFIFASLQIRNKTFARKVFLRKRYYNYRPSS